MKALVEEGRWMKMIKKGGERTMKARTLVPIAVALALLAALVPTAALAGEDTSTGQFTCANAAPDVTPIALNVGGGGATSSMTPQAASGYDIVVTVADANTLDDITQVEVTILYDDDGDDDPGDGSTDDPGDG